MGHVGAFPRPAERAECGGGAMSLSAAAHDRWVEIVDRIDRARIGTGFIAHVDLYPIVMLDRFPTNPAALKACAAQVYRAGEAKGTVAGVTHRKHDGRWRRALIDHVSENPFDHLTEQQCAEAARLGAELADLIATELGEIRSVAKVDFQPRDWYAAVWTDWLLLAPGRATILHLGWDS
ncbi:hypothetical protein AB0M45_32840 [Nocardia sp. NPDC051787]|uniref:hypothetical protein n=1 Tax=Nocardia sp. NPDC051787 TaxID=3155415 RepID=UPI00341BAB9D